MASAYKSLAKKSSKSSDRKPSNDDPSLPKNEQRVLILSSRGVTYRQRHLLNDLYSLLPHSRKDAKLDTKTKLYQLNELAELYNCNNVLFFEARKGKDLYIWMSKAPNGPTVKMHLQNLHTMSELHFPGNCLKGSRPILTFDATFTSSPHLILIKELLTHTFAVPPTSRKTKPFVDHVMGFSFLDGKVWIRCYEIKETSISKSDAAATRKQKNTTNGEDEEHAEVAGDETSLPTSTTDGTTKISLTEIGPRFVLTPIVILEGSFGGPVIYENKEFVSPNMVRSQARLKNASKYHRRMDMAKEGESKRGDLGLKTGSQSGRQKDELDDKVLFA